MQRVDSDVPILAVKVLVSPGSSSLIGAQTVGKQVAPISAERPGPRQFTSR